MYLEDPSQTYPLADKLPLSAMTLQETAAARRLASGPFETYKQIGDVDIFRAIKTGVDSANFTVLTGLPTIRDVNGQELRFSKWRVETENRTINCRIGGELKVGSFNGTVVDISDELVILKQNSGRIWVVSLGNKLKDAVAAPPGLF